MRGIWKKIPRYSPLTHRKTRVRCCWMQINIISVCNEMKEEELRGEKLKSELRMRKDSENRRKPAADDHSHILYPPNLSLQCNRDEDRWKEKVQENRM